MTFIQDAVAKDAAKIEKATEATLENAISMNWVMTVLALLIGGSGAYIISRSVTNRARRRLNKTQLKNAFKFDLPLGVTPPTKQPAVLERMSLKDAFFTAARARVVSHPPLDHR